jgi:hypothetical protein
MRASTSFTSWLIWSAARLPRDLITIDANCVSPSLKNTMPLPYFPYSMNEPINAANISRTVSGAQRTAP